MPSNLKERLLKRSGSKTQGRKVDGQTKVQSAGARGKKNISITPGSSTTEDETAEVQLDLTSMLVRLLCKTSARSGDKQFMDSRRKFVLQILSHAFAWKFSPVPHSNCQQNRTKESTLQPWQLLSTTPCTGMQEQKAQKAQAGPSANPSIVQRRRFLLHLAVALHSYGSSSSRTEYLIDRVADRLDVDTSIAVFPNFVLLSFYGEGRDLNRQEVYMLKVESDLDVDKLGHVDELANLIGKEGVPFVFADLSLKEIATAPPAFGKWWRLFGFAVSASMSAPLFFDGSPWDAVFSFFLGLTVGILDLTASKFTRFAAVSEFCSALIVSFLADCISVHLKSFGLCYFAMTLGSLVQLLPGMALTLGASEMFAKAHVTGSASIMSGLYSSMQLGFGLATGENLMWWNRDPVSATCIPTNFPHWWNLIWFLGYLVASNILLMARLDQWPGMTLVALVGYLVSNLTAHYLSSSTCSAVSAFAVGVAGTSYSYFTKELPLVMVLSGILLLVPGGIGVQGVAAMLKGDVSSGMGFVFDMIVVLLSLILGLLIAKLALPTALHSNRPISFTKKNLPALMAQTFVNKPSEDVVKESEECESDEEGMAI